jgi:hypothetical protein
MLAFALERKNHLIGCAWFWAWAAIGAGFAFGVISFLGVLTLLPTLSWHSSSRASMPSTGSAASPGSV